MACYRLLDIKHIRHCDSASCQITLTTCLLLQVDLSRSFVFRNSGRTYDGIPIMASNMDTIGTFEMAKKFSKV